MNKEKKLKSQGWHSNGQVCPPLGRFITNDNPTKSISRTIKPPRLRPNLEGYKSFIIFSSIFISNDLVLLIQNSEFKIQNS
jgi:hypothetical protein